MNTSNTSNISKTKNLVATAMFAAIITVFTVCIQMKIGSNSGYIHFGDSMIYLASCILPLPYACCAASIGGAMADLLSGAGIWVIPTAIIKSMNVIPFAIAVKYLKNNTKIITPVTIAMSVVSGLITISGYFVAECLIYSFEAASATVLLGLTQPIGSSIVFIFSGLALDSAKFKERLS